MRRRLYCQSAAVLCCALLCGAPAGAFIITPDDPDPWLQTASGARPNGNGSPATITWSIIPDGTTAIRSTTSSATAPSNLVSFMNTNFGGSAGQTNLTLQPWFPIFASSFGRWSQLGGVNFVFEPHDDGVFHPSSNGVLGVRGDIRIGGANIDGTGNVLAFTYVTTGGSDMMIDTSESTFFKNSTTNYINFRNTLMHEIGHAFGVQHVTSSSNLLMEPVIDTSFDGPQLDEVRAVHYFFGDVNEKSNNMLGNGTFSRATALGTIAPDATKSIGTSANVPTQAISAAATDFVSISNASDVDFYSFSVLGSSLLQATLVPRGGVFTQGSADHNETPTSFNANARNNLSLTILAGNGTTVLQTADVQAAGGTELITKLLLPAGGQYFAKIAGADDTVQLYQLSLTPTPILLGDYNLNGRVDGADYVMWRNSLGQSITQGTGADGSFDGQVNAADYAVWRSHFGETAGAGSGSTSGHFEGGGVVPEPVSLVPLGMTGLALAVVWRRRSAPRDTR